MNPLVSDAEFFGLIDWHIAAPKPLRQSAQAGDWHRVVRLLTAQAGGSARNQEPRKFALWSRHDLECPARAERLLATWQAFDRKAGRQKDRSRRELTSALDAWSANAPAGSLQPLETLILYELLREASSGLAADLATKLWRTALENAIGRTTPPGLTVTEDQPEGSGRPDASAIALDAELAWQAGLLFAPVAGSSALRDSGRERLWNVLAESTDSTGVPAARTLGDLPAWMTSVVRAREWGRLFGRPLWGASQEKRLRGIVTSIAKLSRDDGRPALSRGETNGLVHVWSTAVATFPRHLQKASPAANYLLSLATAKRVGPRRTGKGPRNGQRRNGAVKRSAAHPVFQSDASRLACLRSDWSVTANSVLISHEGQFPTLEMALGRTRLLSGDWEIEVRIDGRSVELAKWDCVCWHSDDDGDYVELQAQAAGVRVERQVFLSRTDEFALLSDAIRSEGNCNIEMTSRLPLSPDCAAVAQTQTRECRLLIDGMAVRAFPLALNCPRVEGASGRLTAVDGRLELYQTGPGGLYAPLVLDWNPSRRRSPASWRRLTVGLRGEAVPGGEAAGFLLETGPSKWLIYRSLCLPVEPRSVLGQHTMCETMIGPFVKGDFESMVQVDHATESGT